MGGHRPAVWIGQRYLGLASSFELRRHHFVVAALPAYRLSEILRARAAACFTLDIALVVPPGLAASCRCPSGRYSRSRWRHSRHGDPVQDVLGSTRRPKPGSSPSHTKYSDTFTSAASTVRLVSFDMRRGSILDLLPDFNHGGLWKHGGSKRANTATRTFEKQSGAAVPQSTKLFKTRKKRKFCAIARNWLETTHNLMVTGSNPVPATNPSQKPRDLNKL
jgi:hypothetical protein